MILRQRLCLTGLALLVLHICSAQNSPQSSPINYQLHSWQDSGGGWNFCILPSSNSEHCVLKGMRELKKGISGLPSGAVIYWIDRTPGTGSKLGTYPPSSVIKQVKEYAEKRNIKVEILSSNPLGPATDTPTERPGEPASGLWP